MPEEKEKNGSKVSLRDYVDIRFNDIEKATGLAGENLKSRLDSLNEWRLQNKDERGHFINREEFEAKLEAIDKGRKDNLALWLALGSMAVGILLKFWK